MMNIFKKIILILSMTCIVFPAFGMDSDDGNQGFFGRLWHAAKEHPIITATAAGGALLAGAGIWAYRRRVQNPQHAQNQQLALGANDINKDVHLWDAVRADDVDAVQLWLENGADIGCPYNLMTPLHWASHRGYTNMATLLINRGADIEAKGEVGRTPLHLAARGGRIAVVKLLLNAGADTEAKDNLCWTPLHLAARKGHADVVKLLLDAGASLEVNMAFDVFNGTPLYQAALALKTEVVRTFLHYIPSPIIKKDRSKSKQRVLATLWAFNKLMPSLPTDVRKRIVAYLPEDMISQGHAKLLYCYTPNICEFVNHCPFTWLIEMYNRYDSEQKEAFLQRIVHALTQNRLCQIREWLKDEHILMLDREQVDPEILSLLDPETIEQHAPIIEQNVRAALEGTARVEQIDSTNNNNNNNNE